jgi:alkyl sulfatase BDS1-like metallo-beta-lactamase superfamily hydrolase
MTSGLSVQCAPTAECFLASAASLRGGDQRVDTVSIANESDQVTKEHLVDALAVRGEEGRGTLR